MENIEAFNLTTVDIIVFAAYFVMLLVVGYWAGRKETKNAEDYFLAGRRLPWYVVGGSFIASNISSEQLIGMVGAAYVYGICVSLSEWRNVWTFSIMVWFFVPFLIASKAFTIPEFLERRFNNTIRQFFAIITIVTNVFAFMAAVMYGGGLGLNQLFGWNLTFAIIALAVVAGSLAIYGGLSSVAWTDFFTIIIIFVGGILLTILGLIYVSADHQSIVEGFKTMIETNQAKTGAWKEAVDKLTMQLAGKEHYNRLSVFQPISHRTHPWPFILFGFLSVSIWYNVINQFMIQRVLGAKNIYHARMGIIFAGFMKLLLPIITVVPGLILFTLFPDKILNLDWGQLQGEANRGYVKLVQLVIPIGIRGLVLAALFGAIQSTINSVLNSTSTIFTIDIWQKWIKPKSSDKQIVWVGVISSTIFLVIAIILAIMISHMQENLFVYIQTLYAFFAPPFSAIFLLGILWKRINAKGATIAVFCGFGFGILMKIGAANWAGFPAWLRPYEMQSIANWCFCILLCTVVSLITKPPLPEKITEKLTFSLKNANVTDGLGKNWYTSVVFWWALFTVGIIGMLIIFSGFLL